MLIETYTILTFIIYWYMDFYNPISKRSIIKDVET